MRTPALITVLELGWVALAPAPPAHGAAYQVPSVATPTIQAAVNTAAANADPDNLISINQSPIFTTAKIQIGNAFNAGHRLTIRPNLALPFGRATIASQNGSQTIFELLTAGSVTLQDLDIVRYSTNNADLVFLDNATDILIERCRIGSVWSSVGSAGWSNVVMSYPTRVVVRNCMLFSALFGNFAYGLRASFGDQTNSLHLYNNTVADYYTYGIEIADPMANSIVVLRNNVVMNHAAAAVEPIAYHAVVDVLVHVVTSHNNAFAALASAESVGDDLRISGLGGIGWRRLPRADAAASFVTTTWDLAGGFDPNRNRNFFRLAPAGLLHDDALDPGITVSNGAPDALDHAVTDDWERNARPSGGTSHTDRGADQVEIGTTAVPPVATGTVALWAAPHANPTRTPGLRYAVLAGGVLRLEVFDIAGRRVHRDARAVSAGETGAFDWAAAGASGVFAYRVTLASEQGAAAECRGRIVLVR
jgi:hypothetical protein